MASRRCNVLSRRGSAAAGVSVIVHAVNLPSYRNWGRFVLPMLDNTIAAARSNGARIVLPGTVYNFGPDAFYDLQETSPQNPVTAKGQISRRDGAEAARGNVDGSRRSDRACERFLWTDGRAELTDRFTRGEQSADVVIGLRLIRLGDGSLLAQIFCTLNRTRHGAR